MPGHDEVLYEFGPTRIDTARRTLERDGQDVPIPPRAFDALLLLIQRRGEVVSKAELLSSIWPDTHVEEANLPVMISAIRRATGDDGRHQKYIQTISKSGYRFVGEVKEIGVVEEAPDHPALETPVSPDQPAWPSLTTGPGKARGVHFALAAGGVAAAFAVLLTGYWLVNGGTVAGRVKAASRAVSGAATEKPGSLPASSSRAAAEMWCQKGRYAWNLHTRAGTQRSVEYYQNAVKEDPGYALGYAGLAIAYAVLPSFSQRPDEQERVRARIAATEALRLDDREADAHNAAGIVYMVVDRNFRQADKEFRRAIALDPRSALAHDELSMCLVAVGRTDEAVEHARLSKALDPLSRRATLGQVLFYGRRFMEAETEFEEILKLDPYSYRAHVNLGRTYLSLGKFDDARREFEEASRLSSDPVAEGLMAQAEAMQGDTAAARTILAALEKRARTNYVAPTSFAFALAGLGRMDDALVYLKQARSDRALPALYLNVEPSWDALHNNTEFRNLVSDITLAGSE